MSNVIYVMRVCCNHPDAAFVDIDASQHRRPRAEADQELISHLFIDTCSNDVNASPLVTGCIIAGKERA